jgi:NodT family efflux transporter outer membrane factor (OMF) lipoprotein
MQQPQLGEWIDIALKNNTDLKVSLARLAQARAQAGIAQAARMPVVYASAGTSQVNGASQAMSTMGTASGTVRDQLNLQMSYEFDFWGRKDFSVESALRQVRSAEFGVESYQMSLIAEVAANYFKAVSLRERISINQKMQGMARKNTQDIQRKLALGEATQVMLSQQLIFEQTLVAQSQDMQTQYEQTINQLSYLAGTHGGALPPIPQSMGTVAWPLTGVIKPAQLLCRRPDLQQAESDLLAADADVAVARTLLLPSVSVNLTAGQIAAGLTGLTSAPNAFVQTALSASQLIFDGGARRKGVTLSEARRAELIERYAGAVWAALRDTDSAMVGVQKSSEKLIWLQSNRTEAQKLAHQMQIMLERGGLDFAQLIQIQTAVYGAEDAAVSGLLDRILAQIELYKALGGSLQAKPDDCLDTGRRS